MSRLAVRLGELGIRRPAAVLCCALLLLALSVPGLLRLQVATDLGALVPAHSEASEGLGLVLQGLSRSDAVYGLLEAAPGTAADPERLEALGSLLADAFAASPWVEESRWRPAQGLPSRDPRALFGLINESELDAVAAALSPEAAARRAGVLRQSLSGPMDPEMRGLLRADPFGLLELLGEHMSRGMPRLGGTGEGFISADGNALVLLIKPVAQSGDLLHAGLNAELEAIHERVMAAADGAFAFRFGLTGAQVQSWQISQATRAEAGKLSLASLVVILLLYLGFYRSLRSLAIVLMLLPVSVLITLGCAGYLMGPLNPLAIGFVAIVFGLGIDPAIHMISAYRSERTGLPPDEAALAALREVGPAVLMATLSTSGALLLLPLLDPVQGQIGLLAGCAVLINGLVMLTVLPALWALLGERIRPDPGVGVAAAASLAASLYRRSGLLLALVTVAVLGLCALAGQGRYEATLRGFQPEELPAVRVQRALEAHFDEDGGELFVLARGSDSEAVLAANDRWYEVLAELQNQNRISGFDSLATLRPAAATAATRRERLRQRVDLEAAVLAMRTALSEQGFKAGAFEPALSSLSGPSEGSSLDARWLSWLDQRYLHRAGGELRVLTRVYPSGAVAETAALLRESAPEAAAGVTSYVTGIALVESDSAALLEHRLPRMLLMVTLGLLGVLGLIYRRPKLVLSAFLPLSVSLLVFVAVHRATGTAITPFTMAGILLLIGVGIDDHLFMLARYLEDGRPGSLSNAISGAGRAIFVTTVTSLAAFGVLSFSRFDALAEFGRAAGLALLLAFLASVVLLPALLAKWVPGTDAPDP